MMDDEPDRNPRLFENSLEVSRADDQDSTATPEKSNVASTSRYFPSLNKKSSSGSNNSKSDATPKASHKSSAAGILFSSSILPRRDPFTSVRQSAERKVIGLVDFDDDLKDLRNDEWLEQASLHFRASSNIPTPVPVVAPAGVPPSSQTDAMKKPMSASTLDTAEFKNPPHIPSRVSIAAKGVLLPPPPPLLRTPRNVKRKSVEELEDRCRRKAVMHPFQLLWLGNIAALKVMGFYLVTLETFITCGLVSTSLEYWFCC